ncbi:LLM class flavin-dependent oxidoreductase [Patulibacter sp. NPDC049589]|uniref:LLM class flavin-dependent oxidoreductase n=1 Tax=Patulibacter sp. NPDC049589 TaxID=3154731 RepID=UPI00342169CA
MSTTTPPWSGIGVAVPSVDAYGIGHPVLDVARAAEDQGLDHVWVPDHLVFHRPVLEAMTALAMIAGATSRVRLGTAILNPALRPLIWTAKQLQTLETLAPGRLLLGVGMGGEYEPEWTAAGVDRKQRARRLDEALALLPALFSGAPLRHDGLHHVDTPAMLPAADVPPVLIGGRAEPALRRTARVGDAWLPMWLDPDQVAAGLEQLAGYAAELGRPAPGAALVAFVNVNDDEERGHEEAAELVKRQYGMPYEKVRRWTIVGSEEQVAERLHAYREAGVDGFSFAIAGPDQLTQVERIAGVRERLAASTA